MEGLEVTEINFLKLERTFRVDSEFYRKKNLEVLNTLSRKPFDSIANITRVSDGNHGKVSENFIESGIPYYRGQDVHDFFIENSSPISIDDKTFSAVNMKRSHLKKGDVLLSIVGTIGGVSLVSSDKKATCSCKLAILRPNNANPYYLATFLNSLYGQNQIKKFVRGAVQMGLILEDMDQIFIPCVGPHFEQIISQLVSSAKRNIEESVNTYNSAESLLLSEIGFDGFVPSADNINTKAYSESFLSSGRLDSEYYLPKYDDYLRLVNSYKGGVQPLSEACNLKDKNYSPEDDQEYQYIELSNIGNSGEVTGCTTSQGKDLPSRARRIVLTNDVVVSSIEGSLESCAIVSKAYDGALCSTGFYVVNSKDINSETLLILFKSKPIQAILKQNCSGTILTAINKAEFLNIPIPLIDEDIQEEIKKKLRESISQREKSESLLDIAKRAVEIAIEQDETIAGKYIQDECLRLGVSLDMTKGTKY